MNEVAYLKKVILDVNIVRAVLLAEPKTANVYNCILDKENDFRVVICDTIEKAYLDHLEKMSTGYNQYYQHFKFSLMRQKHIIDIKALEAPYNFSHDDDQGIIDCAHTTQSDIIVSTDGNFKTFKHELYNYECLKPREFLEKYCPEYCISR